ncbi:MAG: flagellar hook capping FlgD N-terminal domain-containing protein [Wujia sp.]
MAGVESAVSGISGKANSYVSSKKDTNTSSDLDKDAFLQLLVTQMQYQDPLNPGDSTEYMSQLAQYSSLEATMNISDAVDKGNALNLVGEYVIMNTTDSTGKSTMVSGLVEYATVKDGEVLLSINDTYYPAEDLDSVVDYDYYLYLKEHANDSNTDKTDNTDNTDKTEDDKV